MKQYRLTITFPFEAADDVEARKELAKMREHYRHAEAGYKLQEIYNHQPPRQVKELGDV
jgi:phage-related protein